MSAIALHHFPMTIETVCAVVRRALRACGVVDGLDCTVRHHGLWHEWILACPHDPQRLSVVITLAPRQPVTLTVVTRAHPGDAGQVLHEITAIHCEALFHAICRLARLALAAANRRPC